MTDREKLKKAQLMIACEIKRICEENHISYFLDAGSMLGAIRHKGFIPWDDDMDIGMLKEDYERFIEIAPDKLSEKFFLDNYNTNPGNPYVFSKVRLKNTVYIEEIGNKELEHNEIFVDVFPYYYISDNVIIRKIEGILMAVFSQAILSKSGYKVWKGKGMLKRVKFIPIDILGRIMTQSQLHSIIHRLYERHNDTGNMCVQSGSCYGYWYFPKEILQNLTNCEFENYIFKIPCDYDIFLKRAYGDYMKLPPKEQQRTHDIIELDFGDVFSDNI